MAILTAKTITNFPRASQARTAVELANASALYAMSRPFTAAGAARATTAAKAKTVNTMTFVVLGQFYSLAGTDNFWTLSGTAVPPSSFQKYALLVDTSGVATVQEATANVVSLASVVWSNVSLLSGWAPFFTIVGSTKMVAAVLSIATDASTTFTPGTTALNASGVTATFVDGIDQSLLRLIGNGSGTIVGNGG